MSKSYFEKLKDPRWQKKRLEVLEANDWICESCMDGESTLHVHHRQYFKGREPWEYETDQLAVLCESCHQATHEEDDKLLLACSYCVTDGPYSRDAAASVVAGFAGQPMNSAYVDDPHTYLLGALAQELTGWRRGVPSVLEIEELVFRLRDDPSGFTKAVRAYLKTPKKEVPDA